MRIRAQRSKVELERGGNDGKWIRSHSTITRTITNTITNTITIFVQLRSQRAETKKTVALPKSGHYLILRTLALCQDSSKDSLDELASAYEPEDEVASDSDSEDRTKAKAAWEEWALSHFASVGAMKDRKLSNFASVGAIHA